MSHTIVGVAVASRIALAALALSMTGHAAEADKVRTRTLFIPGVTACGPDWVNPHIICVPPPVDAEALALAEARDRRWLARCRPRIRHDEYGVERYVYAARGCEFGRLD
jgi:hypothetical protein